MATLPSGSANHPGNPSLGPSISLRPPSTPWDRSPSPAEASCSGAEVVSRACLCVNNVHKRPWFGKVAERVGRSDPRGKSRRPARAGGAPARDRGRVARPGLVNWPQLPDKRCRRAGVERATSRFLRPAGALPDESLALTLFVVTPFCRPCAAAANRSDRQCCSTARTPARQEGRPRDLPGAPVRAGTRLIGWTARREHRGRQFGAVTVVSWPHRPQGSGRALSLPCSCDQSRSGQLSYQISITAMEEQEERQPADYKIFVDGCDISDRPSPGSW